MNNFKSDILSNLCYTELVYDRINKKLKLNLSRDEIETMIVEILQETDASLFKKTGKNIYVSNHERNIIITVNSRTNRIITVDYLVRRPNKEKS